MADLTDVQNAVANIKVRSGSSYTCSRRVCFA